MKSLIFISIFFPLLAANSSRRCGQLIAEYTRTDRDGLFDDAVRTDETRVVVASNNSLRFFNNHVFENWTLASEYISQLQHRFFVNRLKDGDPNSATWVAEMAETPYTKNLQLVFASRNRNVASLSALLARAQRESVEETVRFVFEHNSTIKDFENRNRMGTLSTSQSPLSIIVPSMSVDSLQRLRKILRSEFSNSDQFRRQLLYNYSIGIGHNELDAQFSSKLSSNAVNRASPIVEFSLTRLHAAINGMERQRQRLGEGFNQLSDSQLKGLFTVVRKHQSEGAESSNKAIQEEMERHGLLKNTKPSAAELAQQLRRYTESLNFLDYLPREWFSEVGQAAVQFDQLKSIRFLIYADLKGVGAENMLLFHHKSKELRAILAQIKNLDGHILKNFDQNRPDLVRERETLLERISTLRHNILAPTNENIAEVREKIRSVLREMGISDEKTALWNSGDDFLFAIASERFSSPGQFLQRLVLSPGFPKELRVAALRMEVAGKYSLADARLSVAEIMDHLKNRKTAPHNAPVYAWGSLGQNGKLTYEIGPIQK